MKTVAPSESASPSYATLLFICCMVAFCGYLGSHMRMPVVPLYARSLGATTAQIGLINSMFFLMAGLLSMPFGMLSDRTGRKHLATLGLVILSIASVFLYFSKTPLQLMWISLLFGVGLAAFGPTMMSLVADFSPSTHLGRAYGWYTTALYTAMSLGPAVGGLTAQKLGFLNVFLISGIVIFVTLWAVVLFLPATPPSRSDGSGEKKRWQLTKNLFKNRPLLGCWLATAGGCFGLGMFVTFIPLHAHDQNLSVGQIGLIFSAQGLCNALFRIPFGHLSDRVAKRTTLVLVGSVGFAAGMVGFGLSTTLIHFMLSAVAFGASMALAFTSIGALIAETVPSESRGLAMGGYNTSIYLGMMLSAALMGNIIPTIGFKNGFLATALLNLLVLGFFHLLARDFSPWKKTEPVESLDG